MTGQQIFYQLLQCCPYDKTGFDAEEWESICQMAGAGLEDENTPELYHTVQEMALENYDNTQL